MSRIATATCSISTLPARNWNSIGKPSGTFDLARYPFALSRSKGKPGSVSFQNSAPLGMKLVASTPLPKSATSISVCLSVA